MYVLVTAHLGGDLAFMPKMFTVIKRLKQTLNTKVFLVDTGLAWSSESWVSAVTQHRAPYMVLDGMAYHLAFADGLDARSRAILQPHMFVQLIENEGQLTHETFALTVRREAALVEPQWAENGLILPMPPKGQILQVQLDPEKSQVVDVAKIDVPPNTLPDPSITATVNFVVSEAHHYVKKQTGNP